MKQTIKLKYTNAQLAIALNDWREVYLLQPEVTQLIAEVYKSNLVYRARGSSRRISDSRIREGLKKKQTIVKVHVPDPL